MEATIQYIEQELNGLYPKTEIQVFVRLILEHVCGLNYTEQILFGTQKLDERYKKKISKIVKRIKNYEPVQYILGETEFLGMKLKIRPLVFIPRPETEELVQWITETSLQSESTVLDIGTGSGCIALALKKQLPGAMISAIDVSDNALETARENAVVNGLNVLFFQADILKWRNIKWDMYDIIVSNPPYVRESEKATMLPNVLYYEPKDALFVPDSDPLLFYRRIVNFSRLFLRERGWLFFEINEKFGNDIKRMMGKNGLKNIEIKKDIYGKDRLLRCQNK